MSDWVSQYSAALDERDLREKAHRSYIDAYTKLADRTAALESTATPAASTSPAPALSGKQLSARAATSGLASPSRGKSPVVQDPLPGHSSNNAPLSDLLAQLRSDLASTQRSRADLQTQLSQRQAELATLTGQAKAATKQVETLTREKLTLERRLKDRDEEVRQRQRLVENVHDEMAGLNLELNMAEQKVATFKAENDMLVKRWMDKMGEEAERMNAESKWQ
ncbi:hypothetical protein AAFC00_003402 [Neodothiora populina]|uniref:Autophagy-related protein 16 domain-containing protein n=1 Tax=Neodothiora populina TaxID=2781224 RepID=A0ABR3PEB0_9PEZI